MREGVQVSCQNCNHWPAYIITSAYRATSEIRMASHLISPLRIFLSAAQLGQVALVGIG
jgi:hypothetical protein